MHMLLNIVLTLFNQLLIFISIRTVQSASLVVQVGFEPTTPCASSKCYYQTELLHQIVDKSRYLSYSLIKYQIGFGCYSTVPYPALSPVNGLLTRVPQHPRYPPNRPRYLLAFTTDTNLMGYRRCNMKANKLG